MVALRELLPELPSIIQADTKMAQITELLQLSKSAQTYRSPTLGIDQLVSSWLRQSSAYRYQMVVDLLTLAMTVSEIRGPILHITGEVFRRGINWVPNFAVRCEKCNMDYNEVVQECMVCRTSEFLREPDKSQREKPDALFKKVNIFNKTFEETLREYHFHLNAVDDGFLFFDKEYFAKEGSNEVFSRLVELRTLHPALVEYDLDQEGLPKNRHWVCYIHRNQEPSSEPGKCKSEGCGRSLVPTMYVYSQRGAKRYFLDSELVHTSKFNPCFDDQTEVLTKEGWKYFSHVSLGDELATLNERGFMEWHHPIKVFHNKYDGTMWYCKNNLVDLLVTPNHKIYGKSRLKVNPKHVWRGSSRHVFKRGKFSLVEANNIPYDTEFRMKSTAAWKGEDVSSFVIEGYSTSSGFYRNHAISGKVVHMDDWLEFLGYYLSEGSHIRDNSNEIGLTQSWAVNPDVCKDMRACLNRMEIKWSDGGGTDKLYIYHPWLAKYLRKFGYSKDRFIPYEFKNLTQRKLKILLNALVRGDGSGDLNKGCQYTSISKRLCEDVAELALKCGYHIFFPKPFEHGIRRVYISTRGRGYEPVIKKGMFGFTEDKYTGMVHCVEVPNHTVFVRRNGKCVWSGNSISYGWCFSGDSEVLTKNGIRNIKNITVDDEIATLNPKTFELEYRKPIALSQYHHTGKMVWSKGKSIDLLVTPNHKNFVRFPRCEFSLEYAETLVGKTVEYLHINGLVEKIKNHTFVNYDDMVYCLEVPNHIVYAGRNGKFCWTGNSPIMTLFEKVLTITGMDRNMYRYFFERRMPACYDEQTEVLTDKGWKYFREIADNDMVLTLSPDGEPQYQLPVKRFEGFYKGPMYRVNNPKVDLLVTPNHNMYVNRKTEGKFYLESASKVFGLVYRVLVSEGVISRESIKNTIINFGEQEDSWVEYSGMVYCVEVPNHTVFIRRGNKIVVCGNSMIMVFTDDPESLRRERAGIAAQMQLDPNWVPMVAVTARNHRGRVDMVRLFHTLQEMDYLPVRQEIRERIAAMWGVTPAWQGAPEAFGGLSTQSVTGDTPLWVRYDGEFIDVIPIEALHHVTDKEYPLPRNMEVLSANGWTKPKHIWREKREPDVLIIETGSGISRVTTHHSLMQKNKEVAAVDLKVGEEIDQSLTIPLANEHSSVTADFAWTLGLFVAEGSMLFEDCGISIANTDLGLLEKAKVSLEARYQRKASIIPAKTWSPKAKKQLYYLHIHGKDISKDFYSLCYWVYNRADCVSRTTQVKIKRVPQSILNASLQLKQAFLDGYLVGDGRLTESKTWECKTISWVLAAGLEYLGSCLGYKMRSKVDLNSETNENWNDVYNLRFCQHTPKTEATVIRRIRKMKNQPSHVFDIETEDHTFVGGLGFTVFHNSTQLTVMSRVVEGDQRIFHERIFPPVLDALGVKDWSLRLFQPEEKAEATRISFAQQKVSMAAQLRAAGWDVRPRMPKMGIENIDFIVHGQLASPTQNSAPAGVQKSLVVGTWVEQLSKAGHHAPVIKEFSPDATKLWFISNGVDYVAELSGGEIMCIEKANFRPVLYATQNQPPERKPPLRDPNKIEEPEEPEEP